MRVAAHTHTIRRWEEGKVRHGRVSPQQRDDVCVDEHTRRSLNMSRLLTCPLALFPAPLLNRLHVL